ncbi:hypothetical protein NSA48_08285 [Frisingicoccus caecimuris]|uniref:DUF1700 domain-containing protein n=1 Tax=Frisingicoccus caecimuris TaxID=1796636 RepID=A0A4R2LDK2_9FIRM|nr:hypothetical protein [Frisingicoccus caecimuris]MCR1919031.1 hypothetical protein [Frisingicoccus caecimuris]TCO84809.1 hypothetical protein EV212_10572 [Frisingicoccus caecimuris]
MTKQEYLAALREALSEELSGAQVSDQINYYRQYIEEQIASGRSEADVLEELGDARIIAHNIIDGAEEERDTYRRTTVTYSGGGDAEGVEPTWKTKMKVYGIIALVLVVLFMIIALVTKLIIWLLPSIIVIACIVWIINRLSGR